ncbi:hypothetical protein GCM10025881_00690 [Pseudolysinimonas kribbensis]|uniref:Undecaprenyl-diphosphatase n=1 Tax=Pseudolysinimonas kribbensis TaxID=433641 RepID=A0ABQ6K124_9MICO|nr:undecaprenyl-diphosphate phosphatase [Pseudolysinimonas kribbensis]GMA93245.1 hypothetical protein GCM10025881_00690 [Pseudolysinimonas kribbensis]
MDTWLEAIILGIVQGLTEFLPISSSAHLRIASTLMGTGKDPGAAFIVFGILLGVLDLLGKRIYRLRDR